MSAALWDYRRLSGTVILWVGGGGEQLEPKTIGTVDYGYLDEVRINRSNRLNNVRRSHGVEHQQQDWADNLAI